MRLLRDLGTKPEAFWIQRGERRVLQLFHAMAGRVPAYGDFLKKQRVYPARVKTIADFKKVPLISKDNYLRQYPLEQLCWDGKFQERHWDISSTSGSTGEPFYFPRSDAQNLQYAGTAELYLRANFEIHKKTTLYVNCFALGVWIGGLFTYEAIKLLARRGKYRITLINPGLNKIEIIKAVRNLGPQFDQVILGGYPPFIKDVIDDGIRYGLKWKKYNLGIIFSAEGFSEEFRNYIIKHAGIKNRYTGTLNHYGTVDQGTIAHETPLAVLIRRLAIQRPKLFRAIFPASEGHRLPTLCQYDPELFFFEEANGGVVCSSYSGLPLVRYDLKDNGGVMTFVNVLASFRAAGIDILREAKKAGIANTVWHLPFVYVYERKDMAVSLGGANVYPGTIRRTLHHKALHKLVTGKFTMRIENDVRQNQHLHIHIELRSGAKRLTKGQRQLTATLILRRLLKDNSEFRSMFYDQRQGKAVPILHFWPYEHLKYFKPGGKQQWTVK